MANILFLIEHLNGGGAERVVSEISSELEKFHQVYLVIFEDRGTSYRHCQNMVCVNIPGTNNIFLKLINLLRRIRAVRLFKKKKEIDISFSFINNANLVNVLSGGKINVCSIRTVLSSVSKNRLKKLVEKLTLMKSDAVITLSDYVKQDLAENFLIPQYKIQTIYNPIFRRSFKDTISLSNHKNRINRGVHFLTAGRMVTAKGQWHILKSFYAYNQLYGGKLTILGDGPLKSKLEKLTLFLGLNDSVEFKGFVKDPYEEYSKADVFVLTSLWEGFGNVIIEAMDCALPIICTNCPGGPREIINPQKFCVNNFEAEYGLLIPAFPQILDIEMSKMLTKEEESLLKAMIFFTNGDNRQRFSKLSNRRAQDFAIEKITKEWNNYINNKLA